MNDTALVIPPVHAYVDAPPPDKVTGLPLQTMLEAGLAVTVGLGITEIVFCVMPNEPQASSTIMEVV